MDSAIVRIACALIIVFLVIGAAYFADVVFEPVAFALFFIALVWPLQQALQKRMPRGAALIITIVTTMAVVIKLVSMVAWGGGQIAQWVARNFDRFQSLYLSASKWLEGNDIFAGPIITERFNVAWLFNVFQQVAIRVNSLIGFSLLVFIFLAMGLLEVDVFGKNLASVGDRTNGQRLTAAAVKIARKIRQYMLVRTVASVATGLIIWIFALLVGLELAAAWGVITFALNYIPFIGPLIATALPSLFALVQTGSWELAVFVLASLTIVQFLIGSYFEPLFTGKALSISSFFVVFAVFLWGFLWGLPGTFIGVPIAIAFLTICEQFPGGRWIAVLLSGRAPDEKPGDA
ncbi:AI-2E family transporter [Methylocella sp.]|jgi:predicted PurR-regulated permease PerM|uniref:AI-2E family transporter n=1 Tax=Methylocella sp. TaxID=1978226 RepID=UPI003C1600B2